MRFGSESTVLRFLPTLFLFLISLFEPCLAREVKGNVPEESEGAKVSPSLQPEAIELLKKVGATYKNLKQFQVEVDVKTSMHSSLRQKSRETHISVAAIRPEKMRVILRNAAGQIQYFCNGTTAITYLPRLKQYTQKPVAKPGDSKSDEDEHDASNFASMGDEMVSQYESIDSGVESARIVREEALVLGEEKINCVVIEVEASKQLEEAETTTRRTYWIEKDRGLVRKVESESRFQPGSKEEAVVIQAEKTFSTFNTSEPIGDDIFSFSPPTGTSEVADFYEPPRRAEGLLGKEAPNFTLKTVKGESVQIKKLRGKVVLLSFWASWCGPCRQEMPVIEKLGQQYRDKGLMVFGVNDEDRETIQDYIKENGYSFPTLVDEEQEASNLYNVHAIPTMVVLDREGNVASYRVGLTREAELRAMLGTLGIH